MRLSNILPLLTYPNKKVFFQKSLEFLLFVFLSSLTLTVMAYLEISVRSLPEYSFFGHKLVNMFSDIFLPSIQDPIIYFGVLSAFFFLLNLLISTSDKVRRKLIIIVISTVTLIVFHWLLAWWILSVIPLTIDSLTFGGGLFPVPLANTLEKNSVLRGQLFEIIWTVGFLTYCIRQRKTVTNPVTIP